jgi:MFS family permease
MAAAEELPTDERTTRKASAAAVASEPELFTAVTTREERRRAFLVLFISLTCMGAGQSVMYGILPSLARELGITEFQAQLPFAVSGAIWLFTSTYWGKRSDHWGRRPVILMGLTAFGISFALFAVLAQLGVSHVMAVAFAYPAMIAARAIYGIFGSGASPASQAYVADRTTRTERTQGVATINAAFGLGTTFGPVFGTVLVAFGVFVPFYFTALVAFASAASIWFLLPERTRPKLMIGEKPAAKLSWRDPRILPLVIFGTGVSTAGAIPIPLAGYVFIDLLHLRVAEAPQYTNVALLASALAALFAQLVIVQRFNMSARALVRWGTGIGIVSFVMLATSRQLGPLVVGFVVSGLGFGLVRPGYGAAASLAVNPDEQGAVAGIMSATSAAGFIFGPLIATKLYKIAPSVPFWFGGGLMIALMAYAYLSPHLKAAGALAPDSDVVDETAETQIPNA